MSLSKVLITGSSKGLGYYLAKYFAFKGHSVIIHGRNKKRLEVINEEIKKTGTESEYFISNLENSNEIIDFSDFAIKKNVKILINNAGVTCPNKPFQEIDYNIIKKMIDVNITAPIMLINLLKNNIEQIININSMSGLESKKNRTIYAATKWGFKGFSESLKKEENTYAILDVYPTNIRTWPERKNAMNVDFVVKKIYSSMISKDKELILDGRINDY
tara:strand:+ start:395 stop:1045 length:651 start_codon:yes stop_codon:yes gene_type:complete